MPYIPGIQKMILSRLNLTRRVPEHGNINREATLRYITYPQMETPANHPLTLASRPRIKSLRRVWSRAADPKSTNRLRRFPLRRKTSKADSRKRYRRRRTCSTFTVLEKNKQINKWHLWIQQAERVRRQQADLTRASCGGDVRCAFVALNTNKNDHLFLQTIFCAFHWFYPKVY